MVRISKKAVFLIAAVLLLFGCFFYTPAPFFANLESNPIKDNSFLSTKKSEGGRMVLSYCVYGKNAFEKYRNDITDVINDAADSTMYQNWDVRVYNEGVFPKKFIRKMKRINPNAHFCDVRQLDRFYPNISTINGMAWRFIPIADDTVDVSCIRDVDSPLLAREEDAVKEWLESDKILHVMRDSPVHSVYVLGGLWCFRNSKNRIIGKSLLNIMLAVSQRRSPIKEAPKGDDQTVLNHFLWPVLSSDVMQHDSFLCEHYKGSIPFPTQRKDYHVGCIRPCRYFEDLCPKQCRPLNHTNWLSC